MGKERLYWRVVKGIASDIWFDFTAVKEDVNVKRGHAELKYITILQEKFKAYIK